MHATALQCMSIQFITSPLIELICVCVCVCAATVVAAANCYAVSFIIHVR